MNEIEMPIFAQDRERVMPAKSGNPKIVCRYRLADLPELQVDSCIVMGRFFIYAQHQAIEN
jgi:hypothetical protein